VSICCIIFKSPARTFERASLALGLVSWMRRGRFAGSGITLSLSMWILLSEFVWVYEPPRMSLWYIFDSYPEDFSVFLFQVFPVKEKVIILCPRFDGAVIRLIYCEREIDTRKILDGFDYALFYYKGDGSIPPRGKNYCTIH
jgi:hypothetical protein